MNLVDRNSGNRIRILWIAMTCVAIAGVAVVLLTGDWLLGRYIVARQFGTGAANDWRQTVTYARHRLYRGKPTIEAVQVYREDGRFYNYATHNRLGLRGPEVSAKKGAFRILAVGDSTTWGYGVEDDETWPHLLQQRLDPAAAEIEVINAGVVGYSAFQIHDYLTREGMALNPDIVVVTTGFNDAASVGFHDMEDMHYSPGYVNKVRRIISRVQPADRDGADQKPRLEPEEYLQFLLDIVALCNAQNAQTVFLDWPDLRAVVDPEAHPTYREIIMRVCESGDAHSINMYDMVDQQLEPVFLDMCHFSPRGNELAAVFIAEQLRPFLPVTAHTPKDTWELVSGQFNAEKLAQREGNDAVLRRCAFLDCWLSQHHSTASLQWELARIGIMLPDECGMLAEYLLRRAAEIAPYIAPVFFRLDAILETRLGAAGRHSEWQRMSAITPYSTSPAVHYLLSKGFFEHGDLSQALDAINKALDMEYRERYITMQTQIQAQMDGE